MATAKYPTSLFVATSFIILFCSTADCVDKVSTRLGQPCARDENCASVANARCWRGFCVCQQDYIQLDNTTCLPPTLLGFGCGHTAQCEARVRHSACIHGVCRCGTGFVSYRRHTCLKAVPINAICYTQEQCSEAVEHSVCDFLIPRLLGRCVCKKGYWMVNGRCRNTAPVVEPVTLGQKCVSSAECRAADPDTRCSRGRCLCRYPTFRCRASRNGCHPDTFQCRSTPRCISWYFVCNGNDDCEDGSDEANCHHSNGVVMAASRSRDVTCPHTAIHCDRNSCVGRASVCDGINNCPNGADEIGCQSAGSCPPNSFRCQTGECRPLSIFCNGVLDCIDGSDEPEEICRQGSSASTMCPFRCGNGRCRSTAVLCSGTNGCGDNSDELPCTVCKCANKTEFESRRSNVFNPGAVFHTREIFRELHKEKLSK